MPKLAVVIKDGYTLGNRQEVRRSGFRHFTNEGDNCFFRIRMPSSNPH